MKSTTTPHFRHFSQTVAALSGFSLLAAVMTVPAIGAVSCTTTAPVIDQVVTCTGSGSTDISVPAGAILVSVVVNGAGGGAGYGTGGAGGNGAEVRAEFLLSATSTTRVMVGTAGSGGATTNAGLGGEFSAIYRGASSAAADAFVVAGGGGGGQGLASGTGRAGGAAAVAGTAAGGNGTTSAGSAANGADGSGNGGSAGDNCGDVGTAGQTWTAGGAGGAGYSVATGGSGGAGYGGGGGGSEFGSGGAGGSFAEATMLNGVALYSATGGAGGTVSGSSGGNGANGSVVLTFKSTVGSGFTSSTTTKTPTRQIFWQGAATDVPSTVTESNTWVKTPTTAGSQRPGDRLLGWSTDKDFSVDIATRQVNNGWGAYEIFNTNGSLRAVFIPVGSYTFVGNDNTLYAIWANGPLLQRC